MTRRPLKKAAPRKARKTPKRAKQQRRDPLDDLIVAGARAFDLTIDKAWMPAVRANLAVMLRLSALVTAFALPDEAEPAPVFKA